MEEEGFDSLLENMEKIKQEYYRAIVETLEETADTCVEGMKRDVHIDTGSLQSTLERGEVKKTGEEYKVLVHANSEKLMQLQGRDYAYYHENGWTDLSGNFHEGVFYFLNNFILAEKDLIENLDKKISSIGGGE